MKVTPKKLANDTYKSSIAKWKHNKLNVGKIALEQPVGALINCSLLQTGGVEPKWD